jgi:glycerol-3-phosphate dehydrogenase
VTDYYDVVIIGAGIQGAGVAQAAAAAGYRVLVLEKTGVAAATSSQSSKLIHGGLRYLETGQFRLVRESLRERTLLLKLAPELVKLVPFHLPVYRTNKRPAWQLRLGLSMYAVLAGFQAGASFSTIPRRDWSKLDGLQTDGLVTVFRYHDAQTDDARLTQAVMKSAQSLGAELLVPAEFFEAEIENQQCRVVFQEGAVQEGSEAATRQCRCAVLVNCAGPWASRLLEKIRPRQAPMPVDLVQGSHLWLTAPAPSGCYYLEAPSDRRGVFVMPWYGETLLGTTETPHSGPPETARTLSAERQYLLNTASFYFPRLADVTPDQIKHEYCGLRVLPKTGGGPFRRSREVMIHVDRGSAPRLVSVMGGKLTAYRLTAQKVMAAIAPSLPPPPAHRDTAHLPLSGD